MELRPKLCLKCGIQIIGDKNELKSNFAQYYFELSSGNLVAAAFCTGCKIEDSDLKEIKRALNISEEIVGIAKKKKIKDIVLEKHNDTCCVCGLPITNDEVEVMPGMAVRHIVCPAKTEEEETNSSPGAIARDYNERKKRTGIKIVQ